MHLKKLYPTITADETFKLLQSAYALPTKDGAAAVLGWWVDGGLLANYQAHGSTFVASYIDQLFSGKIGKNFPAATDDFVAEVLGLLADQPGVTLAQLSEVASFYKKANVLGKDVAAMLHKLGKTVAGMEPLIVAETVGNPELGNLLGKIISGETTVPTFPHPDTWKHFLPDLAKAHPGSTLAQLQQYGKVGLGVDLSAADLAGVLQGAGFTIDATGAVVFHAAALPLEPYVWAKGWIEDYGAITGQKPTAAELIEAIKAHYPTPGVPLSPKTLHSLFPGKLTVAKKTAKKAAAVADDFDDVYVPEPDVPPPLPPKPPKVPKPKAPKPPVSAKAKEVRVTPEGDGPLSDRILAEKLSDAKGSNPGGLYRGSDGVVRYVKFYEDPTQALGEHLANRIYRAVGVNAPDSLVFEFNGRLAYASVVEQGQTLQALGITAERASQVLDGFVGDVLVGNWDAVGTGLDNVLFTVDGRILRIDNGGSLLFRAKAGRKPANVLEQITEWDVFASGQNPYYRGIFDAAGVAHGNALGKRAIAAIDRVTDLVEASGLAVDTFWARFIDDAVPAMASADRSAIGRMLAKRTTLLREKRAEIVAYLEEQEAAVKAARLAERKAARLRRSGKDPDVVTFRPGADRRMADAAEQLARLSPEHRQELRRMMTGINGSGGGVSSDVRYAVQRERQRYVARELQRVAKIDLSEAEAEAIAGLMERAIGSWAGSSNSEGGALLKYYAERRHGVVTTFQGSYLDLVAALRARFQEQGQEALRRAISQISARLQPFAREHFDLMMDLHHEFSVAVSRAAGKKTITLYRGVKERQFRDAGEAVPTRGQTGKMAANSLASYSTDIRIARQFGRVIFKVEVPVDNVLLHWGASADLLGGEAEYLVLGKPLRYEVVESLH